MMLLLPLVLLPLVQLNIGLAAVCAPGQGLNQSSGTCIDCDIDHYKHIQGNSECMECPDNSNSTYRGAVLCECINGYYRTDTEDATVQCTAPPTAPSLVYAISMRFNSINIGWTPPTSNGGRTDVSYRVTYTNGNNTGPVFSVDDSLSYNITGLSPLTQYIISVTSVNGVSDQDTDNDQQRTIIITVRTEDLPSRRNMPQSSSDVDWRLILGIVIPTVFFILLAIVLYLLIYILHKYRSSSSIKQPIKCNDETDNKGASPLPPVTNDAYYIDDTKVGRRVIGVDPLYDQVKEDQQTTPNATTADYLFIMPLRDQNDTTIDVTAVVQTPVEGGGVIPPDDEHEYEETDRHVKSNANNVGNDNSTQPNGHVYETVAHCRKESSVSLV